MRNKDFTDDPWVRSHRSKIILASVVVIIGCFSLFVIEPCLPTFFAAGFLGGGSAGLIGRLL